MGLDKHDYDALVVGSGPNGLAAAITLQQAGVSVCLLEAKNETGGGLRSAALTLPGFSHDICAAVHPLAAASPFFNTLPLSGYGWEFIYPRVAAAHPLLDGRSAALYASLEQTAQTLGEDANSYLRLMQPLVRDWPGIIRDVLGPLHFPSHPLKMARFGWKGFPSARHLASRFRSKEARGLLAGMAAHAMQPLSRSATSAFALVLLLTGHSRGWPVAKGGSGSLAKALTDYFLALGGRIEHNVCVRSLGQLPSTQALLFDVTPRQLLQIAGKEFSALYHWQLKRYRYGMGVFKIDWALAEPIPFTAPACRAAGTVHLGNTFEEIAATEQLTADGRHPERPFVLLAQPSLFDPSRAPEGRHTAWAYCHVPNGSEIDMTERIENQVERFAPGFRDLIMGRHTMNTVQMESYNANYVGGDINGGVLDLGQLFTRPALRFSPYKTSAKGVYICSSSTPPGGGVHGMCGYHAAKKALKDVFKLPVPALAGF